MPFVLQNVEVRYGARTVLSIDSLAFRSGAITAVMGPNGSGKTTLLKILAGLLDPSHGTVTYEGEALRPEHLARLRQKVCLVHQVPLLFNTTVLGNIAFGLKARGVPRSDIQRRVSQVSTLARCLDLLKRRARELSGGEEKRVAIARALVLDSEVLLLDEPFANVDQTTAKALEEVLRASGERGQTLIFSTHDGRLAYRLARHVVVLREGRLSPSPYENLFAGRLLTDGETAWFDTGKVRIAVPPVLAPTEHISIGPDEILLSIQPLSSSARNVFRGRLTRIEERREGVLDVGVEAGEPFTVRVTQQSFQELGLAIGAQVYITFKSTAVKPF